MSACRVVGVAQKLGGTRLLKSPGRAVLHVGAAGGLWHPCVDHGRSIWVRNGGIAKCTGQEEAAGWCAVALKRQSTRQTLPGSIDC